jgi:hypothetical protein
VHVAQADVAQAVPAFATRKARCSIPHDAARSPAPIPVAPARENVRTLRMPLHRARSASRMRGRKAGAVPRGASRFALDEEGNNK